MGLYSICIPSRDRTESLERLVQSLQASRLQSKEQTIEIIIVDGTKQGSVSESVKCLDSVKVLRGPGDATSARNIAAEHASGTFVAFIDDDVVVQMNFCQRLRQVLELIEPIPAVAGVVGNTVRQRNDNPLDEAWLAAGFDRYFSLSERYSFLRWGCTANLVVRRQRLLAVHGFRSTAIPVGGEDIDFGMRVTQQSVFLADPQLIVYHEPIGRRDIAPILRKAAYYGESEQWLAEQYPAYAHRDIGRYRLVCRLGWLWPKEADRIRLAFQRGAFRYAWRKHTFLKTISPSAMARATDEAITNEVTVRLTQRPKFLRLFSPRDLA